MSHHPRALLLPAATVVAVAIVLPRAASEPPTERAPRPLAAGPSALHAATDLERVSVMLERIAERQRRARLRALRGRPTVSAALERAVLRGELSQAEWRRGRRTLAAARNVARSGAPGAQEIAVVLARTRELAAGLGLHADRIPAQLLTIARNVQVVRRGTVPGHRERVTFPGDPVVYERYAGEGLQIQWLGSWGKVNWRAGQCLEAPRSCPRRRLAAAIDRLVALASSRGGFLAWEYRFAFAGGNPPWVSAIAQATAAQALARAGRVLDEPRYRRLARAAIGAFAVGAPTGVSAPVAGGGRHYLMYSFNPALQILNGHIQALVALHDVARLTGSRGARRLFRLGEHSAAARLSAYDTGAWSLYSAAGAEASLSYHRLVAGFLSALCDREAGSAYCDAGQRFERYEHEPPRLDLRLPRHLRVRRAATVRLELSKMSVVSARANGPVSAGLIGGVQLPYGDHVVRWVPPAPGRYRIVVDATDLAGNPATLTRAIRVRPAPRPHRLRLRRGALRAR